MPIEAISLVRAVQEAIKTPGRASSPLVEYFITASWVGQIAHRIDGYIPAVGDYGYRFLDICVLI
jgi:hypothetical protein